MSTRSVIAQTTALGFRGRYVHYDGYPTAVGEAVRLIVARDGVEVATRILTKDHYGWASVDAAGAGARNAVVGYGEYFDDQAEGDWITNDGDSWGTEYAYAIMQEGIEVSVRIGDEWRPVALVAYDDADGMRSAELTAQRMRLAYQIRF